MATTKKSRLEIFKGIVERSRSNKPDQKIVFTSLDTVAGTGITSHGYKVSLKTCNCPANKTPNGCVVVKTAKGNTIEACKHVICLAKLCGIAGLPQLRDRVDGLETMDSVPFSAETVPAKVKPQIRFRFDRFKSVSWISMSYTTEETIRLINEYASERGLLVAVVPVNGLTEVLLSHPDYTSPADSYGLQMRLAYALMDQGYQVTVTG
jgi:hypothetical protein